MPKAERATSKGVSHGDEVAYVFAPNDAFMVFGNDGPRAVPDFEKDKLDFVAAAVPAQQPH